MKEKYKLIPYLVLLPLLLANSPSPYPGPIPYEDFTYTQITMEPHGSLAHHYVYETTITNVGFGYISLEWIEMVSFTDETVRIAFSENYYSNQLIKPNGAFNFTITESVYADDFIIPHVLAYVNLESDILATIQGPLAWTEEAPSLELQIPVTYSGERLFTYSAIVELTIEGMPLTFITHHGVTHDTIYLALDSFTNLDLNDIEVNHLVLVPGRPLSQGLNLYALILGFMTIVSVIFGGFTLAALLGLVFWLMKKWAKKQPRP